MANRIIISYKTGKGIKLIDCGNRMFNIEITEIESATEYNNFKIANRILRQIKKSLPLDEYEIKYKNNNLKNLTTMNTENKNTDLKNLAEQLNGVKPVNYQIITVHIQDPDIIKFSNQCTELIKRLNPETIHQYNLSTIPVPVPGGGIALSNICICQYWATDEEVSAYKEELKRKNLFIKP